MMRSLSSAVAGLRTHQTKMDVIGNNIANVNTYGFKASRTTFSDVYYQSLSGASAPSASGGGVNPTQIGYGASVASIDVLNTRSGMASTDRAMDVYITGEGFLVTQDANGNQMYTRLGNLGFDEEGNLVDSNGNYVMGFPQNADGTPIVPENGIATNLQAIRVPRDTLDKLTNISIGTGGEIVGILPGGAKVSIGMAAPGFMDTESLNISADSNIKGSVELTVRGQFDMATLGTEMAKFGGMTVTDVIYSDELLNPDAAYDDPTHPNNTPDTTIAWDATNQQFVLTYTTTDSAGKLVKGRATGNVGANGQLVFKDGSKVVLTMQTDKDNATDFGTTDITTAKLPVAAYYQARAKDKGDNVVLYPEGGFEALPASGEIAFGGLSFTLISDAANTNTKKASMHHAFKGVVAMVGTEEGERVNIGCLVLAKFRNQAGLDQVGNSAFMETTNSGEPTFVKPGAENTGGIQSNYLEMSNVDIAKEFSDMITTQRGFQANTRIVTVSDEMLQELVNLKR